MPLILNENSMFKIYKYIRNFEIEKTVHRPVLRETSRCMQLRFPGEFFYIQKVSGTPEKIQKSCKK